MNERKMNSVKFMAKLGFAIMLGNCIIGGIYLTEAIRVKQYYFAIFFVFAIFLSYYLGAKCYQMAEKVKNKNEQERG